MADTVASTDKNELNAVQVDATYKDPVTGALYVHSDLVQVQEAWAEEAHIRPPKANEQFGDVESWVAYVQRFARPEALPFLRWSSVGLDAVLDYHGERGGGNRCQWTAGHPFLHSPEWKAWLALANAGAVAQRTAIEKLEDRGADIVDPPQAELMHLLRNLRATVNATAQTELLPDGTTRVGFSQDKAVRSTAGDVTLPPEFSIAIPVLKGDTTLYRLAVKLRASIDDNAHLTLRFAIPNAERTLEAVYEARVNLAKELLGDAFSLLRGAG